MRSALITLLVLNLWTVPLVLGFARKDDFNYTLGSPEFALLPGGFLSEADQSETINTRMLGDLRGAMDDLSPAARAAFSSPGNQDALDEMTLAKSEEAGKIWANAATKKIETVGTKLKEAQNDAKGVVDLIAGIFEEAGLDVANPVAVFEERMKAVDYNPVVLLEDLQNVLGHFVEDKKMFSKTDTFDFLKGVKGDRHAPQGDMDGPLQTLKNYLMEVNLQSEEADDELRQLIQNTWQRGIKEPSTSANEEKLFPTVEKLLKPLREKTSALVDAANVAAVTEADVGQMLKVMDLQKKLLKVSNIKYDRISLISDLKEEGFIKELEDGVAIQIKPDTGAAIIKFFGELKTVGLSNEISTLLLKDYEGGLKAFIDLKPTIMPDNQQFAKQLGGDFSERGLLDKKIAAHENMLLNRNVGEAKSRKGKIVYGVKTKEGDYVDNGPEFEDNSEFGENNIVTRADNIANGYLDEIRLAKARSEIITKFDKGGIFSVTGVELDTLRNAPLTATDEEKIGGVYTKEMLMVGEELEEILAGSTEEARLSEISDMKTFVYDVVGFMPPGVQELEELEKKISDLSESGTVKMDEDVLKKLGLKDVYEGWANRLKARPRVRKWILFGDKGPKTDPTTFLDVYQESRSPKSIKNAAKQLKKDVGSLSPTKQQVLRDIANSEDMRGQFGMTEDDAEIIVKRVQRAEKGGLFKRARKDYTAITERMKGIESNILKLRSDQRNGAVTDDDEIFTYWKNEAGSECTCSECPRRRLLANGVCMISGENPEIEDRVLTAVDVVAEGGEAPMMTAREWELYSKIHLKFLKNKGDQFSMNRRSESWFSKFMDEVLPSDFQVQQEKMEDFEALEKMVEGDTSSTLILVPELPNDDVAPVEPKDSPNENEGPEAPKDTDPLPNTDDLTDEELDRMIDDELYEQQPDGQGFNLDYGGDSSTQDYNAFLDGGGGAAIDETAEAGAEGERIMEEIEEGVAKVLKL